MTFPFCGERLAVDLLNTVVAQRGRVQDLLEPPGAVAAWAEAAGVLPRGRLGREAKSLRTFRETLRRGLVAWAATGRPRRPLIALLNRYLARDPEVLSITVRGGRILTLRRGTGHGTPLDRLYGAVARSAAGMLASDVPGRLRKCTSCPLMFYDVSKAGRRRWCSMQTCGARAKARAFSGRPGRLLARSAGPPIRT